jgi:hypothetical protein
MKIVSIFRCSSTPDNPVYTRRVDPSTLPFKFSSHRHLYFKSYIQFSLSRYIINHTVHHKKTSEFGYKSEYTTDHVSSILSDLICRTQGSVSCMQTILECQVTVYDLIFTHEYTTREFQVGMCGNNLYIVYYTLQVTL